MDEMTRCIRCYHEQAVEGSSCCQECADEAFDVFEQFGVQPNTVGNRPRGWWIVGKIEDEELAAGAHLGDLCVKTRDGASNPIDPEAFKVGDCIGSVEDGFDCTYRYYYYRALEKRENKDGA